MSRIRRHLTYSNIAATLALVLALGGTTAYAANLITSKDIKNGTIKVVDLANKTRSHVYSAYDNKWTSFTVENTYAPEVSLYIPHAGKYVIIATTDAYNFDTANASGVTCKLVENGTEWGTAVNLEADTQDSGFRQGITIQAVDTFSGSATVVLSCQVSTVGTDPTLTEMGHSVVTATSVDSLTNTNTNP